VTGSSDLRTIASAIHIRPLTTPAELRRCVDIQREVWGPDYSEVVPPPILTLATRLGGILAGAFDGRDEMIGFVFGMTGVVDGGIVHWSDMLAVRPAYRDRGIGDALKRYQRDVLLRRGIERVQWTFEPLEGRNAHVNFARLGVTSHEYVRDFYGGSDSPLHGEIGTDRLVVEWPIASGRVRDRLTRASRPPGERDIAALPRVNTHTMVDGHARSSDPVLSLEGSRVLLAIPADIQSLKRDHPEIAREWRAVTRASFESYFGRGFVAVEYVRGGAVGFYMLERGPRA
jgi:chorismate synthase